MFTLKIDLWLNIVYHNYTAQPMMIYQIPTDERMWSEHSRNESYGSDLEDEPDYASVSHVSSSAKPMGPILKEMVDIFHDGDEVIVKNKK